MLLRIRIPVPDDRQLASDKSLCLQITRAEYTCPEWFTPSQTKLISRILDPNPRRVELQNVVP